ncbi:MAG: hypothetical protein JNK47_08515 [Mesorhizobium sp.]|jgi:hypothetical protein|nr:hypothetical protein [Mesorhizobium sp.]MBL8577252.1 hypothetical protein [Mesorhizobium sp.]
MNPPAGSPARQKVNWRCVSLLIAGAVVALFVAANAHLFYVAFTSQPDCVPHARESEGGSSSTLRAARSAC